MTRATQIAVTRAGLAAALALIVTLWTAAPCAASGTEKVDKKASSQFKLAYTLYQGGRLAESLTAVDRALAQEPRYAQARLLRGMILAGRGAWDEALPEFDKALAEDKNYTDARLWRGDALANLKRHDEAMKEFETAAKDLKYPWPERAHCNIGMLKREMHDPQGAIESFQKALKINPSYGKAYYELGITYDEMNRPEQALRAYQDAQVGMDDRPELHLKLGLALLRAGSGPKARQHFERVLKLSPDGPEAEEARDAIAQMGKPAKPS